MQPVVADLGSTVLIKRAFAWQGVGILLMLCHVILVKQSLLLFPLMISVVGWLYLRLPLYAVFVCFPVVLVGNLLTALFAADMHFTTFAWLQKTNIALFGVCGVIALWRMWPMRFGYRCLISTILVTIIMTAFLLDQQKFQLVVEPLLNILVGIDVGRRWGYRTIAVALFYTGTTCIAITLIELYFPLRFYDLINASTYLQLKFGLAQPPNFNEIMDHFRLVGSVLDPDINAYLLAVVALVGVSVNRSDWLLIITPLLMLIAAVGAASLLLNTLILWAIWRLYRKPIIVIGVGLTIGSASVGASWFYHPEMAALPFGYVICVAIAVLLSAPIGGSRFYMRPVPADLIYFALGLIVIDGIVQFQAYALASTGVIMLLGGVMLGNQRRQGVFVNNEFGTLT